MFSLFKLFENKENTFSYENQTKTNFENKENEFTIFNILYMNQKTVVTCILNTLSLFSLTSFSRKWFYKTDFLILYFQPNSSTKRIF